MRLYLAMVGSLFWASVGLGAEFSKKNLKSEKQKMSYAIGVRTGSNLVEQKLELDKEAFLAGVEHALEGEKKLLLSAKELAEIMEKFHAEFRAKLEKERKEMGEKNIKAGEAFLVENKKKEGVVTTASGLQYKILVKGKGAKPRKVDTVVTHYVGTLINGEEFDSSRKRGTPASFPVTGVIAGWTEALQLMPIGSKWMLYIPSALAYGERGSGGRIAPNAVLVFEIELLDIK